MLGNIPSIRSIRSIPSIRSIRNIPNRILVEAGDKYILFTTETVNRIYEGRTVECVKLKAVKNSGLEGFLHTGSDARRTITTYVERDSARHGPRIYKCQIEKTSWYLQSQERIYVYSFNPILVLPSIVYHVKNGRYLDMNWHLELNVEVPEVPDVPDVPDVQLKIPIHVLKLYIDGLIRNNETCPITMEELKLGNISVTGCGHAFEKGSLDRVLLCPICRMSLSKEDYIHL